MGGAIRVKDTACGDVVYANVRHGQRTYGVHVVGPVKEVRIRCAVRKYGVIERERKKSCSGRKRSCEKYGKEG